MGIRIVTITSVAAGLAVLTGCSTASQPASTESSALTSGASASSPADGAGTVRLLAHDSFVVSDSVLADFEKKTGLKLQVMTAGDAGTMVAGAVLAAGQPTADVMFGVDNTQAARAVDAGVFTSYTSPEASALRPELANDTYGGQLTPIDYGDVCVNIHDASLKSAGVAAPTSLDDLVKPEYKDMLVVEDPATSSPGTAFLLATIARYGDGWKDYWKKLAANGVKVDGSWTDAYMGDFVGGGGEGTRPMVVSYATSPPAEIVYASDPKPDRPSTSVLTDGCYRQVEYAGVLAGTENPQAAQQVIDWLSSPAVQEDVPLSMFVFPARTNVTLPDVWKFAATVPTPLQLPSADVAANLATWLSDWGQVMGR